MRRDWRLSTALACFVLSQFLAFEQLRTSSLLQYELMALGDPCTRQRNAAATLGGVLECVGISQTANPYSVALFIGWVVFAMAAMLLVFWAYLKPKEPVEKVNSHPSHPIAASLKGAPEKPSHLQGRGLGEGDA